MFNSSKDANVPAVYLTTPSSMNIVTPFLCLSICPYGHRWPSHNARRATRLVCYSFRSIFHLCKKRRGRCPFKWSTWRVWPVINEYAVSHGSCKETSGSTGERGYKEGDILTSLENSWSIYARMTNGCTKHAIVWARNKSNMLHFNINPHTATFNKH